MSTRTIQKTVYTCDHCGKEIFYDNQAYGATAPRWYVLRLPNQRLQSDLHLCSITCLKAKVNSFEQ